VPVVQKAHASKVHSGELCGLLRNRSAPAENEQASIATVVQFVRSTAFFVRSKIGLASCLSFKMQVPHIVMLLFALFAAQTTAFMPGGNIFEQLFNGGQQQQFQGQQQQQQQDGASDSSTYRMGYEGSESTRFRVLRGPASSQLGAFLASLSMC
jgi:hypothetical protein